MKSQSVPNGKKLRITFLLPGGTPKPVGGFKVVYEYANHLAKRGHSITIVCPASCLKGDRPLGVARSCLRFLYRKANGGFRPGSWFQLDPLVRLLWVRSPSARRIPDADVIVATAWPTAEWVADYPLSKGRKFYLIQHLETWGNMEDRAYATWKLPLTKIVIAKWLQEIATGLGEESCYVPNGLDFSCFVMKVSPEQRDPCNVMMLYHKSDWKGSADGLRALSLVHDQVPELRAVLFGVPAEPADLPSWIRYYCCPRQGLLADLYNAASIFVAPSWAEGWPLPPAEAMMSGAALVATDIGGHREFALHGETALLSPAKQPEALAENIVRLIRNSSLRIDLAHNGYAHVQQFTWNRATDSLESCFLGISDNSQV